jgi:hypothetical protein
MRKRRSIFDGLVFLSLFNLLLLRVWAQLLPAVVNPANLYYMEEPPHRIHYLLVLFTLFAAAAAATGAAACARSASRRWSKSLTRGAMLALAFAALNAVAAQLPAGSFDGLLGAPGSGARHTVAVAVAGVAIALLWWRPGAVVAAVELFGLVALPFLLMTVAQALWTFATWEPDRFAGGSLRSPPAAERLPPRPRDAPRVVLIVFDELDQRAAFTARPQRLSLPELDRLQSESLVARNAFAPARETRRSVASMLLGRQVSWAMPSGPTALPCAFDGGGEPERVEDCWSDQPNLFARVRARGVNAAVAGWYHPYCRLFAPVLSGCAWAGLPYWNSERLRDSFGQQWHEVVKPLPLAGGWLRPGTRIRGAHRDAYQRIQRAALRMAGDAGMGFTLLHFPVPHHPDIWDPTHATLSVTDRRSYFDNLELADRTLGEVRAAMTSAGLWDRSSVIVTSDHWWRAIHREDWGLTDEEESVFANELNRRVPFLVKLARQRARFNYPKAFNTLLVHDLVLALLAGEIETPRALAAWIDQRRLQSRVPYPVVIPGAHDRPASSRRRQARPSLDSGKTPMQIGLPEAL